jgi:uncharacterized protein
MISIDIISDEFIVKMKELFGESIDKIILYGSYSRGDFDKKSDIDYLVVLKEGTQKPKLGEIGGVILYFRENFDALISIFDVSKIRFINSTRLFYRNVKKDGKIIYG